MKVEEIMTRKIRACRMESDLGEVAHNMWEGDCGIVPVTDGNGRLVGILTDRDICIALGTRDRTARSLSAGDVMTRQVHTCGPEDDVRATLKEMGRRKIRRLPVVGSDRKVQGVVSVNDILLRAEAPSGRRAVQVPQGEVIDALKQICAHRTEAPKMLAAGQATRDGLVG